MNSLRSNLPGSIRSDHLSNSPLPTSKKDIDQTVMNKLKDRHENLKALEILIDGKIEANNADPKLTIPQKEYLNSGCLLPAKEEIRQGLSGSRGCMTTDARSRAHYALAKQRLDNGGLSVNGLTAGGTVDSQVASTNQGIRKFSVHEELNDRWMKLKTMQTVNDRDILFVYADGRFSEAQAQKLKTYSIATREAIEGGLGETDLARASNSLTQKSMQSAVDSLLLEGRARETFLQTQIPRTRSPNRLDRLGSLLQVTATAVQAATPTVAW